MKLVLSYKESVKLYTQEFQFKKVVDFIESEMSLRRDSITMSYLDSEGDKIGIGSDEDLAVMLSLLDGKDYIKIHIEGVPLVAKESPYHQAKVNIEEVKLDFKVQRDKELEKKKNKNQSGDQEKTLEKKYNFEQQQKNQDKKERKAKKARGQKESKEIKEKPEKKQKSDVSFETFNSLMSDSIATLVDERVRALIPCIREQVLSNDYKLEDLQSKLIHEKYTCFLCEVHPIIGVRYVCPKCQNFSLCSSCQSTFDHEHNLIKIKHLEDVASQKIESTIKDLYQKFFAGKNIKRSTKEVSKVGKIHNQRSRRFCRDFKLTFGGKLADYSKLVEENSELTFMELLQKYCEESQITLEEGHRKYIELLLNRMSKKFKKEDPETLKIFIEEHSSMDYKDIEKLYDQGLKEKLAEQKKILKDQKAKEKEEKQKQRKDQKVKQKEEKQKQLIEKKEAEDKRKKEADRNRKNVKEHSKKDPGDALVGVYREIYDIMVEMCGKERAAEYPAFIEKHKTLSKEDIVQNWWNQISYIEHQG